MAENPPPAPPIVQVALPGLLGCFAGEQQALLAVLAGLDSDAPRTLTEAAALLGQDVETIGYQVALLARTFLRGVTTPLPESLRLAGAFVVEGVSADLARPGVYTLHHIVPAIRATTFPASRENLTVVNVWEGGVRGVRAWAGVRLHAPEGAVLGDLATEVVLPGEGAVVYQALTWERVVFPAPGRYQIAVWLGGAPLHAYFLPAYLAEEQHAPGA